jgi:hypothetical protein
MKLDRDEWDGERLWWGAGLVLSSSRHKLPRVGHVDVLAPTTF